MKHVLALLASSVMIALTFYLAARKRIDWKLAAVFLAAAIASGLAIENYVIQKFRYKDLEIEIKAYEQRVNDLKDEAIEGIQREVQSQNESLDLVTRDINRTAKSVDETYSLTRDIALSIVKLTWWQTVTKSEFGGARDRTAREAIEREINSLLPKLIPDQAQRDTWIRDLYLTMPPRPSE